MKKYKVGVIGATGMVGQRFVSLLADHPWFEVAVVAASSHRAGKTYRAAGGESDGGHLSKLGCRRLRRLVPPL